MQAYSKRCFYKALCPFLSVVAVTECLVDFFSELCKNATENKWKLIPYPKFSQQLWCENVREDQMSIINSDLVATGVISVTTLT